MFCKNCGAQLPDDAVFCSSCGASMSPEAPAAQPVQVEVLEQYTEADKKDNKVMGIVCYLGILVLIPILAGNTKNSKVVAFHAKQGFYLACASVAAWILSIIPIINIIAWILNVAVFVYMILGIINVVNEKVEYLPAVGEKLVSLGWYEKIFK